MMPIVGLVFFSSSSSGNVSWETFGAGILLAFWGTLALFWMMARREALLQKAPANNFEALKAIDADSPTASLLPYEVEKYRSTAAALEEVQQTNLQLRNEIEVLAEELQLATSEKEQRQDEIEKVKNDLEECRQTARYQMEQQQGLIRKLQESLAEQKTSFEKKQQQISSLESKVSDLTYEIKTLLQIAESSTHSFQSDFSEPSSPPFSYKPVSEPEEIFIPIEKQIRTLEEASLQLKRCLDIAQKITGSHRFNSQSNMISNSPADSFALDLRRLCDSLRSENISLILLYSPKENQLLFANNQIKPLTGWSPEKFVHNFKELLQDENAWKQGVASLAISSESAIKLVVKTKTGNDIILQGVLGMIPTGIFRYHTIAVLFSTAGALQEKTK
jgi:hypothetical protein